MTCTKSDRVESLQHARSMFKNIAVWIHIPPLSSSLAF